MDVQKVILLAVLIVWSVEPPAPSNGLGQRVMQGMRRPVTAPTDGPINALSVTQSGASGAPSGEGGQGESGLQISCGRRHSTT